ncbi:24476_t:CDS:2 [Gigaspora margarita]|uniref:24476_t:CDS:1 n=1 Tax=Gigaspora margarita TaxID=4874 RepID=A0ABN7UFM5_GIGMA|nr:24476_t:CDS:2 [Gigaspora margarita]
MVLSDELVKLKGCEFGNHLGISENVLNEAASVPLETLADERIKLRQLLSQYEPENIYKTDKTGNRDKSPENNELDSEYEDGENFISESSENDEISNSEELMEELIEVLMGVLMEKLVKLLMEVLIEVLMEELIEEHVEGCIKDHELKGPVAEIIVDLSSSNDPEASNIAQTMERYVQIVNEPVATEGILDDEEIITMVQAEENEQESNDD